MNSLTRFGVVLVLASLAAACGGKSAFEGDRSGGGDGQGGSGQGGSGQGGSGQGGSGQGGSGQGGSGAESGRAGNGAGGSSAGSQGRAGSANGGSGGDKCAAYDDESPIFVQVLIVNQTKGSIYLGQDMVTCGVAPLFNVADAQGAPLPALGNCRAVCVQMRKEGIGGCPAFCAFPTSIELKPGEVLSTMWDGLYRVQGSLPGSCTSFEAPSAQLSCDQAKRVDAGSFVFSARAGSAIDCTATKGSACAACMVSGNGGCSTPGSLISGDIRSTTATISLDARYGLDSAGPAAPSPGAGAAVLPTVELIFRD